MALPKIDTPTYTLELPLSKKTVLYRPFLVKEQRNLMMALEADDKETVERNVRQVLTNCTLSTDIDIDELPVLDIEYYFINLRARSVGEIVENKYICTNIVGDNQCGNKMDIKLNLLEITVDIPEQPDVIKLTDTMAIKLKYPKFSIINKLSETKSAVETAFEIMVDSIDYIFDGQQYYYAVDSTKEELTEFIESLNQEQFSKLEAFFENLPKIKKHIDMKCNRCGFDHSMDIEGLENFFG